MLVLGQRYFGFFMVYTVISKCFISYEISCLLLSDFMFSCFFHVFLNNFLCYGWTFNGGGVGQGAGVQISNIESMLSVAQWVWMAPLSSDCKIYQTSFRDSMFLEEISPNPEALSHQCKYLKRFHEKKPCSSQQQYGRNRQTLSFMFPIVK